MLQQVLTAVPPEAVTPVTWLAGVGAVIGAGLWLFGARFSRSLLTLVAVAVGAWIGLNLARWVTLPIGGWAAATVGALVFGIAAYALHGLVVAIGLALNLAVLAAVVVFVLYGAGFTLPLYSAGTVPGDYLQRLWDSLPAQLTKVGPIACGVAVLVGLALTMLWARFATYLLYSLLGVTMLVGLGLVAMELARPQFLSVIPAQRPAQIGTLVGMVLFGVIVQWRMNSPRSASPAPKHREAAED